MHYYNPVPTNMQTFEVWLCMRYGITDVSRLKPETVADLRAEHARQNPTATTGRQLHGIPPTDAFRLR